MNGDSAQLSNALLGLIAHLASLRVRWAIIGGLAIGVRAEPRTTLDIDVAIAAGDDRSAERIVIGLRDLGYVIVRQFENTATRRLATVRVVRGGINIDLMFASSGIEPEIVGASELGEVLPGVLAPIATGAHLLALKLLAGRPDDLKDVRNLLPRLSPAEIAVARTALELISRRGFDRGKDLIADLEMQIRAPQDPFDPGSP